MKLFCVLLAAVGFSAPLLFEGDAAAQAAKPPSQAAPKNVAKGNKAPPPKTGGGAKAPKKGGPKKAPRKPGSEPGEADEASRRIIAGTSGQGTHTTKESAELRALRELDAALFPSAKPDAEVVWPAEGVTLSDDVSPHVSASGLPPETVLAPAPSDATPHDLGWLSKLDLPDIPVRWDARLVRYLEYYKNNPRGRSAVASWIKKSGKYGGSIRRILHEQGLPEDIVWLSLVESGFDPSISSPAGAAGLWQFMPEGARIYGLTVDRWVDERLDPERSTVAAAKYLADLHQRFGTWELAFAAYNMGYGGLLSAIRKYNTNDFWELSRLESGMPLETALYVPKIVAIAVVARNRAVFGCDDVELDSAITFDKIAVGPGVSTRSIALAAAVPEARIEELNPQLLASRTPLSPPASKGTVAGKVALAQAGSSSGGAATEDVWTVRVPAGLGAKAAKNVGKLAEADSKLERITVRWGETLDDIATRRGVSRGSLMALNALRRDEVLRPKTTLLVPASAGVGIAAAQNPKDVPHAEEKPVVVVPAQTFAYVDRTRWFYRVVPGDTREDVAAVFGVTSGEICRWNALDPSAVLHEGMVLQIYAPSAARRDEVLAIQDKDATVLTVGTPEFYSHFEALRGRTRVEVVAKEGDTWRTLAKKAGLTLAQMERINQRARTSALSPGDKVVMYVPASKAPPEPKESAKVAGSEVTVAAPPAPDVTVKDDDAKPPHDGI